MSDAIHFDNPGGVTLPCDAATAKYLRLYVDSSGEWHICGIGDKSQAVAMATTSAAAEQLHGRLHSQGTTIMVASGAVTVGDEVYAAASGKVSATPGGVLEGIAITAASNDGDQIAVLPSHNPTQTWAAFTHTCSAGEGTATEAVINTNLGVALTWAAVHVKTSAGVPRVIDVLTFGSGADAGKITVGSAALATNDIIHGIAGFDSTVSAGA